MQYICVQNEGSLHAYTKHNQMKSYQFRTIKNIRKSNCDDNDVENVIYGGSAGLIKFYA